ncbi:MAG: hypothetical protein JW888_03945 [Pirellulales bacterium]|nr:hypothetical protein [Pirellulales bacterium]
MTESNRTNAQFHCPNEPAPISRAVHLARLAACFPKCRRCPHRADTADFSPKLAKRLAEAYRDVPSPAAFDDEGISGVLLNELTPEVARRAAVALGLLLREQADAGSSEPDWPTVLLGGDGRRATAPLVAAAAEGLRFAGCHVADIGQATSGSMSFALARSAADGGLLVGNPTDRPHHAGLRFWDAAGPLSRGTGLDRLESLFDGPLDRPTRRFGSIGHVTFAADYTAGLADYYHALRPLVVVLATNCRPLVDCVRRLSQSLECRFVYDASIALRDQIADNRAHLAVSIDGNGETCHALDERGATVPDPRLLRLVARHLIDEREPPREPNLPKPIVVLEKETPTETETSLARLGWQTVRSTGRRAAMHRTMINERALLGGGPSGRFWYAGAGHVAPDALVTLSLLLVILSQSDQPFSAVLDRMVEPE